MEFVDRLGELLAKPQLSVPAPASTIDRLMDRQLDLLGDSVWTFKRAVENPDLLDAYMCIDELPGWNQELREWAAWAQERPTVCW